MRYHHTANFYIPGANGDNWYGAGGGVTPCSLLVATLWDRHPTAPGFRFLKYAQDNAGYSAWKPGGSAWVASRAEWDKMVAAAAVDGDTLDVQAVVVDCSTSDVVTGSLTFSTDLQALISGIRAQYSATAKIILVSHRSDFYLPGGTTAQAARILHNQARIANAGVHIFDMGWAEFGTDGPVGSVTVGPAQITYRTNDYVEAGVRLGRFIEALLTSGSIEDYDGPLAVDVMLGDSNFVVSGTSSSYVIGGKQRSLLGDVGGTVRQGQWIFDGPNTQVVPYDVAGVTNSVGNTEATYGQESSMLARLKANQRRPAVHRCVWKFAIPGASLLFLETGWPEVQRVWREFLSVVYRDTGRVVDVTSINFNFGRNDGLGAEPAANFVAKAVLLLDMARQLFTTKSSGKPTLVNWVQPSPHASNGVEGGTIHGDPASLEEVRQFIATLPTLRENVNVLLDPDAKRYELNREDLLHYSGRAVDNMGEDLADLILAGQEDAADADQVGGEDTTQLVESAVDTSPSSIVAILEQAIAEGSDVASYTTATGQTVTLRSFDSILRALQYFEAKASRKSGLRRTRVAFT